VKQDIFVSTVLCHFTKEAVSKISYTEMLLGYLCDENAKWRHGAPTAARKRK
jgi:hypothetical protein